MDFTAHRISPKSEPYFKGSDYFCVPSELMSILSGALGIEAGQLIAKMVNYSPVKVAVQNGLIKAEFLHIRYAFSSRRDLIDVDNVSIVWGKDAETDKITQLGIIRERIETQQHYKTEAGFEKAVTGLIADHLNRTLCEKGDSISISTLGWVADPAEIATSQSNREEKAQLRKVTAKKKSPAPR